jgi:hypothetical protein
MHDYVCNLIKYFEFVILLQVKNQHWVDAEIPLSSKKN